MNTYLYRLWAGNELLYVGISKSYLKRLGEHMEEQPWADEITNVTCEVYATRQQAIDAEKKAVENEYPKHNKYLQKKEKPLDTAQRQWAMASVEDRQKILDCIRNWTGIKFDESSLKEDKLMGAVSRMLILTNASDDSITFAPT